MRTVDEHLAAILARVCPATPVRLALQESLGLVAAEGLHSVVDLPGFDSSAMDGYAVHAADVARADPARPGSAVRLPVVADLAAGDAATRALPTRSAARIMTGAMLPPGADAVVPVEDTDGGTASVGIRRAPAPGAFVRRRGEDLRRGAPVLQPGTVVGARTIGLLAAAGHGEVLVHPRPLVGVVSTGAELVEPGRALSAGRIYDANSHLLAAAVATAGGVTAHRLVVGDDPEQLRAVLDRLAEHVDVLVTSGGVSKGVHDVVKEALEPTGCVEFVEVAMQPGKPQGFGVIGQRQVPVFALPGNPVSAAVSFEVFVRPALRTMLGLGSTARRLVGGRLTAPLRSPQGRRQFARARAAPIAGSWRVEPLPGQGSHFVADLAAADALVVVPEAVTSLAAGDAVEVLLLDRDCDREAA